MLFTTKLFSTSIDDLKRRVCKVLRFGNSDVQTALEVTAYGIDSNPVKDMVAIYGETSVKGQVVIIGYLNKNQKSAVGELRLFSTDANGTEKGYLWLKNDGIMELLGDKNFAVKYKQLETAFNALQKSHNDFLAEYQKHTHVTNFPVITTAPPVSTQLPDQADITKAKNEKIKTND